MDDSGTPHSEALLDAFPDPIVASLEVRDAWRRQISESHPGLEFVAADVQRWPVGTIVRVAFLDGDPGLHAQVAGATDQIAEAMNLTLDFGYDAEAGTYRRWTVADTTRVAEIRVSFDMGGYWSLVGTDSTDTTIDPAGGPIGGLPGQRSLNLGGYAQSLPEGWEGTVRHEFMHALSFHHEHQNFRGPCADEFRWDDDSGYVPTRDPRGVFVKDAAGRAPGIYTYLAGEPNRWPKAKVDHNLRTSNDPGVVMGGFDRASIMLYRFADFFYKTSPSPCAPSGPGLDLSDGDKRGLGLLYPHGPDAAATAADRARRGLDALGAEGVRGTTSSEIEDRLLELLAERAAL